MKISLSCILILICYYVNSQPPLQFVNTLIGTAPATTESSKKHGSGSENRGQTFPGVGRPFGMTQWTAETRTTEDKCISPYYYNDKYITGFRGSHWMSGSCTQDYGSASVMPFVSSKPDTIKRNPASKFSHRNESATPALYRISLDNSVSVEMSATTRAGIMRFTFPGKSPGYILIRMNSDEKQGKIWIDKSRNEIAGYNPVHRLYQGKGESAGFSGYFVLKLDKPFELTEILKSEQQLVISVGLANAVTIKAACSFTGIEGARKNLEAEIPSWDLDGIRMAAEKAWANSLAKINVRGGSDDDKVKFYTALYHCFQLPRIASDADGSYNGFAGDTTIHKAGGFDYYDDFSMWDTYRALHPLLTILEPGRTSDMIKSLVLKAEQGGWMPIFPAWNSYTAAMIGDHCSAMIADSYLKGISGFDAEKAYKYMRQNAFDTPPDKDYKDGKGRRALTSYLQYGYIPLEDSVWDAFHRNEQVSRTLEYSFDDYALSEFAKALGKDADYQVLKKRSENWKNVFDTESKYVRGRYADGKWTDQADPDSKAKYICEGTPAQYTWYVPHDIPGLIQLMGGRDHFLSRLDAFFDKGSYWHGNEPGHQVPYLYTLAGRPDKTSKLVQEFVKTEYGTGPGGISGNEDAGQMSAWLVFSMMGFYPVCPASNQYVITTPAFDEVRINLGAGKYFLITSLNRTPGINYIRVMTKDGGRYSDQTFRHEDILKGSRFTLQLDSRPPY